MKGSTFLGFAALLAGVWLIDCAYKGRPPLSTLMAIIQHPRQARDVADASSSPGDATAMGQAPNTFGNVSRHTNAQTEPKGKSDHR